MLDVRNLSWPVGESRRRPIDGLSFALGSGEVLAVTGPAGSGKSILLRILAGAVRRYAGEVFFQGTELGDWSRDFYESTGAVTDPPGLAPQLTALENLRYQARLYRRGDPAAVPKALDLMGLAAAADVRAGAMDSESLFLVALARAQLHRPLLLCIDTPPAGLSPAASERLGEALRTRRSEGLSTVLASRDAAWAGGLCGRSLALGGT